MEEQGDTASLRSSAAHWTLAGDKRLLDVLQGIHERIISKCQATNTSLEEMVRSLDTASVKLQNVNNRFMALSNSQFVESRVYDDDVDVATTEEPVKEPPKPVDTTTDLSKLKESLRVLESFHEGVQILDSDSDSGSDEEERLVYKPKDMYAERPLPYIIGSQQWRSKWHVGLIPEDSDSDSSTSKRERPPSEQYSESEPEGTEDVAEKPHASQRTISTTSSLGSELTIPTAGKPADIAAELARRLGGTVPPVPEPEPEPELPPVSVPTKVYKPQQPTAAVLFADEPPPLDQYQSDSASEDDIFAELHRNKPRQTEKQFGSVVDELFGKQPYVHRNKVDDDMFGGYMHQSTPIVKQTTPLFNEPQGSDLFTETPQKQPAPDNDRQTDTNVKKPVGGISLFGNNKGTESIGAAILKRNQHRGSTDEESEEDKPANKPANKPPNKPTDSVDKAISKVSDKIKPKGTKVGHVTDKHVGEKTERDIINDLFSKPKKNVAETAEKAVVKNVKKVDLFSDNLFDDIDDIFTSNVTNRDKRKESDKNKKSLFDDDDDDLFADVAVTNKSRTQDSKSRSQENKSRSEAKGLFDSDDDLFSEKPSKPGNVVKTNEVTGSSKVVSDTELLSNENDIGESVRSIERTRASVVENKAALNNKVTGEGSINRVNDSLDREKKPLNVKKAKSKVKSIFDSDSDDDIFADFKASKFLANDEKLEENPEIVVKKNIENVIKPKDIPKLDKLDDFDNGDSLFVKKETEVFSTKETQVTENKYNETNKNIEVDEFGDDLFKSNKKTDTVLAENKEVINKKEEINKEVKNNITEDENQLISNKNKIEAKEVMSNFLSDNGMPKSQAFRSPSLFGDDDDMDDLFNKTTEGNSSKDSLKEVKSPEIIPEPKIEEQKLNDEISKKQADDKLQDNVASSNNIASIVNDSSKYIKKIGASETIVNEDIVHAVRNNKLTEQSNVVNQNEELGNEIRSNILQDSPLPDSPNEDLYKNDFNSVPENPEEHLKTEPIEEFTRNEPLFSEAKEPVSNEPDIFTDIFSDVPPEFEKPKEPKKSRNINALFDDDSDDEALFFKRDDAVTDEKPDISFGTQERLFHIFHDEPPSIDVDFTQKHSDGTEYITKDTIQPKKSIDGVDSITKFNNDLDIKKSQTDNEQAIKTNNEISGNDSIDLIKDVDEVKKPVGKLKPMNLNINVTSLLPGASPKKTKSYDQNDGQVATKNLDDLSPKDDEPKMVKSVSFEGDPDSEVLDNKLSKERAKIQVKRRPSTRRARREAVRKSGIDFGDDSTDNSGSLDLPKNTEVTADKNDDKLEKNDVTNNLNNIPKVDSLDRKDKDIVEAKKAVADSSAIETAGIASDGNNDILDKKVDSVTAGFNTRTNVKSKVVYILNDEDIFTNTTPELQIHRESKSDDVKVIKNKVLNIVDDDDDLFKTKDVAIGTLGNAYKDVKQKEIDKFDSDEDIFKASQTKTNTDKRVEGNRKEIDNMEAKIDELFVKTTKITENKTKTSVFDVSDDEDELFGSKNAKKANVFDNDKLFSGPSNVKDTKRDLRLPVKGSLFGDDSDDDLFGGKTTKNPEPLHIQPKAKVAAAKTSEPVFEDPLSMQDDEDDL